MCKKLVKVRQKFVTTCSLNGPMRWKVFAFFQNFFGDDVTRIARNFPQFLSIAGRIIKSVYMIDAEAIDNLFPVKMQQGSMILIEHAVVFHAQTDQFIDSKESAVVDESISIPPKCRPIVKSIDKFEHQCRVT